MVLGIIEALQNGSVTFRDLPDLNSQLKGRFNRILSKLTEGTQSRKDLQETILREVSIDVMDAMMKQGEIIFEKISREEFSHTYGWIEAKRKFWQASRDENILIFGSHKNFNLILDGLEKIYGRHLPRKTEHPPEVVRMLEIAKLRKGVEEHYETNRDHLAPGESQD